MDTTVSFIRQATGATMLSLDSSLSGKRVTGITWDSREVKPGDAFLTITGERVDGNDYVVAAIQSGASMIIMTGKPDPQMLAIAGEFDCAVVKINDAPEALVALAAALRGELKATVIGVTGSSGKTTTKDIITAVLGQSFEVVSTRGNHNNELGVPYTVLSADPSTAQLVVEMGMRGRGQLTNLCGYVKPDVAVITNIGVSHMELLGSQDEIARAKGEMLAALPQGGCAILPGDDAYLTFLEHDCVPAGVDVVTYGLGESCDVRATDLSFDDDGFPTFSLHFPDGLTKQVTLHLQGIHNVRNALAAAAVGYREGMFWRDILDGIESAQPASMRLEVVLSPGGVRVINDSYNANPDSMRAALSTLSRMSCEGRKIAVLGDMGELGPRAGTFHREIGAAVAQSDIDLLFCVGELASEIAQGALDAGMPAEAVRHCPNADVAIPILRSTLEKGDLMLVKASRSMGLENIVKGITG